MEISIKDPIHNFTKLNKKKDAIFIDLINTKEFQRLRRIKQLGLLFIVYPTAEHSRFSHSIGTFEVARKMLSFFLDSEYISKDEYDERYIPLLASALLHDIGHGPFSHVFELFINKPHEEITKEIILGDTEVNQVLRNYNPRLPEEISKIFSYSYPKKYINNIISGQLDADRLDYITRDSYQTGVGFGTIDINRIISIIILKNDQLGIIEKGIGTVENYLLARHQMFWEVYLHKTGLILVELLKSCINRIKDLSISKPHELFIPENLDFLIKPNLYTLKKYLELDDVDLTYFIKRLMKSDDIILSDLASRIIHRRLFKAIKNFNYKDLKRAKTIANSIGFDERYYVLECQSKKSIYEYGKRSDKVSNNDEILVYCKDGKVMKLSEYSQIIKSIQAHYHKEYLFVPEEVRERL